MRSFFITLALGLFSYFGFSQANNQWIPLPPEVSVTNGPTNGMWFTSPNNFTIKALKVPDDSMNPWNPQSIAVLKFTGNGASLSPSMNYSILFLVQDTMTSDSIPCNINIEAGDHIGIIGSRWDASSNVGQCSNAGVANYSTIINGTATPVYKLLANSPLNNQAPSNVWMPSTSFPITRMEMYYEGCDRPNPDSVVISNIACNGDSTGTISAFVSGIFANSTMEWSTGDSNINSITNLSNGTYGLTITSPSGCVFDTSIVLIQPTPMSASATLSEPTCHGGATGVINASISGGTAPYSYSWNTGDSGSVLQNVSAGSFTLTITDDNGCTSSEVFILDQPDQVSISLDALFNNSCPDDTNGQITIDITGGFQPYTATWNDEDSTIGSSISGLANGTYTVTATDFYACEATESYSINASNNNPTIDLGPDQIMPNNGLLLLYGPLGFTSYIWSTGSTFDFIGISSPGTYWLEVTDENTCSGSDTIEVFEPAPSGIATAISSHQPLIYPNPTDRYVHIQTSNQAIPTRIRISDMQGKTLLTTMGDSELITLDLSGLPSGFYFLETQNNLSLHHQVLSLR